MTASTKPEAAAGVTDEVAAATATKAGEGKSTEGKSGEGNSGEGKTPADKAAAEIAAQFAGQSKDDVLRDYLAMLRIRRFEESAARAYTRGKISGFLHLYIGQEAIAVGTRLAIQDGDRIVATYRDHGFALAQGLGVRARAGDQRVGRVTQEHREARVEHVARGHPEVKKARGRSSQFLHVGEERDDVMLGGPLDGVDPLGVEFLLTQRGDLGDGAEVVRKGEDCRLHRNEHGLVGGTSGQRGSEPVQAGVIVGEQQLVLGGEMPVEGPQRHPGVRGDLLGRGALHPLRQKAHQRRLLQRLTRALTADGLRRPGHPSTVPQNVLS